MQRIWSWIERFADTLSLIALACLVLLPVLQVILRDFFTAPIIGLEEATRWGLIALVFFGLPLLIGSDAQIRFPELVDKLPLAARRALQRFTLLLSGGALAVLVWAGIGSILKNRSTRTPTLDIPFWLFATPFLLGVTLTAVGCFWFALRRKPPEVDGSAPTL